MQNNVLRLEVLLHMNEKTSHFNKSLDEYLKEARQLGNRVELKFAPLHPRQLLRNDRQLVLLLDELMNKKHRTQIDKNFDGKMKEDACDNLSRCIQFLEMKHRINSHNFLLCSATLSIGISIGSLILGVVSLILGVLSLL